MIVPFSESLELFIARTKRRCDFFRSSPFCSFCNGGFSTGPLVQRSSRAVSGMILRFIDRPPIHDGFGGAYQQRLCLLKSV